MLYTGCHSLKQSLSWCAQASLDATTPSDYATLAYISLIGGAASYGIFFYNASVKQNLTALSSLTFLTPLFAVVRGHAQH